MVKRAPSIPRTVCPGIVASHMVSSCARQDSTGEAGLDLLSLPWDTLAPHGPRPPLRRGEGVFWAFGTFGPGGYARRTRSHRLALSAPERGSWGDSGPVVGRGGRSKTPRARRPRASARRHSRPPLRTAPWSPARPPAAGP